MGMDVWKVTMERVDSPKGIIRDFLFHLAVDIEAHDGWGGGWLGNVFIEVFKDDFESTAFDYAAEKGLSHEDMQTLVSWVKALPWNEEEDDLTLTINW